MAVAVAVPPPFVTVEVWPPAPPVARLVAGAEEAGAAGTMALAMGIWAAIPPTTELAGTFAWAAAAALA